MSGETLDQLVRQADRLDAGADLAGSAAPEAQAAPTGLSNADCLVMAGQIIRDTLCGIAQVQSPRITLADGTLKIIADACAPVLDKYGIKLNALMDQFGVEVRAAIVTVPIILAARRALLVELAAKAAPKPPADAAAPQPTAAAT